MYGREARLTADIVYGTVETDRPVLDNDFITTRCETLREAFKATRETLGQAARHCKKWYDMRSRPQTFATGDCLVLSPKGSILSLPEVTLSVGGSIQNSISARTSHLHCSRNQRSSYVDCLRG